MPRSPQITMDTIFCWEHIPLTQQGLKKSTLQIHQLTQYLHCLQKYCLLSCSHLYLGPGGDLLNELLLCPNVEPQQSFCDQYLESNNPKYPK